MSRPPEEFYRAAEARPHLIYEICQYRRAGELCRRCPQWEQTSYGPGQRACYGLAVELIAKVLEDEAIRRVPLPDVLTQKAGDA